MVFLRGCIESWSPLLFSSTILIIFINRCMHFILLYIYFSMLYRLLDLCKRRMWFGGKDYKLKRIWQEWVLFCVMLVSWHFPEELKTTACNITSVALKQVLEAKTSGMRVGCVTDEATCRNARRGGLDRTSQKTNLISVLNSVGRYLRDHLLFILKTKLINRICGHNSELWNVRSRWHL